LWKLLPSELSGPSTCWVTSSASRFERGFVFWPSTIGKEISGMSVDISTKAQRKEKVSGEPKLNLPQASGFGTNEGIRFISWLLG
jgi:hypothetical protein